LPHCEGARGIPPGSDRERVRRMAHAARILLIDNHATPSPLQGLHMAQRSCHLSVESDPVKAVRHWAESAPDLVVFDVDLPEARLADLIRRLRDESVLPILVLAPSRKEDFILSVYAAGADEFIHTPISLAVLEARLKVWCRRSGTASLELLEPLRVGEVRLSPIERILALENGSRIRLTRLEMRLMYNLMGRPGRAVTLDELCNSIWGNPAEVNKATLKNAIYRLRQKIEADPARPRYVCTVAGVGYKFGDDR
jgi:DNA-binding response OmpR family regulator